MTPPYPVHTTTADTQHAKASAAKRLRSNGLVGSDDQDSGLVCRLSGSWFVLPSV